MITKDSSQVKKQWCLQGLFLLLLSLISGSAFNNTTAVMCKQKVCVCQLTGGFGNHVFVWWDTQGPRAGHLHLPKTRLLAHLFYSLFIFSNFHFAWYFLSSPSTLVLTEECQSGVTAVQLSEQRTGGESWRHWVMERLEWQRTKHQGGAHWPVWKGQGQGEKGAL